MEMESEQDDQTSDGGGSSETQESQETRPASKLRDLKPEKDPMGAGIKAARDKPENSGSDTR